MYFKGKFHRQRKLASVAILFFYDWNCIFAMRAQVLCVRVCVCACVLCASNVYYLWNAWKFPRISFTIFHIFPLIFLKISTTKSIIALFCMIFDTKCLVQKIALFRNWTIFLLSYTMVSLTDIAVHASNAVCVAPHNLLLPSMLFLFNNIFCAR